jgi:hypothetical protein
MNSKVIPTPATLPVVRLRSVALPVEHGSWGFLLEPIVAGLAIAFSLGGVWIALLTIGAFLARQPLKVLLIDRLGMKVRERARAAFAFLSAYGTVFVAGLIGTVASVGWRPLLPFACVLPFAVYQIYCDASRRSRQLVAELIGAVSISASVAAIALSDGRPWAVALSLWLIFVLRLLPSILYVRNRLLLEKGKSYSRMIPTVAHVAALTSVTVLAYFQLAPVLTVFAMLLLLWREVAGLAPGRRKLRAMQIGVLEIVYGVVTVISVIIGYYTGI